MQVLLADDNAEMRSLVGASMRGALNGLTVLEAADGAEAIQVGLQQRPRVALLDVDMPRVDGIAVAVVLRELVPQLRLALYSGDVRAHRDRAKSLGLPLFDKSDLDRVTDWVAA
jgi:two-component system response regulator DesR